LPLPVGTYQFNANTAAGQLIVSSSGTGFTGTALGNPIVGFFDETSQAFRFLLTNAGTSPPTLESYTGTLFTAVSTAPDSHGNTIQTTTNTLAGLFEYFPNSVSGPITTGVFTWLATMSSSVKTKEAKEKEASKDTKDVKDHKDAKEGVHEKIPAKDAADGKGGPGGGLPEVMGGEAGGMPAGDLNATISQLMQRLSAVEQQLAIGQSFIAQEERPEVGLHAIEEPRPGFPQ
jgi:hypothetical protein